MKTVREIFRLPVNPEYLCIIDVEDEVAHAINNVDALADAVEAALPTLKYNRSISDSADRLYLDAALALAAYRGAK